MNKKGAGILGYATEEITGQGFAQLWFDEQQETAFLKRLDSERRIADHEVALRRKDRSVIWVLMTAALTDNGIVVCSAVDITEKKRAKDELIESELRYRTLFDGASDAIFIHDIDGRIFETNLMASRYLGYTKRELMQKHMQDLAVDAEMAFSKERIGQLVSRGYILFESAQKRKEGSIIQVEISSRTTEYFGMGAVVSIVRDISERKPA